MKTLETSLKKLESLGQSVWLDTIDRQLIRSGQLKKLTERDGLSGVTSNPAIFEKAINETDAYNDDIARLIKEGKSAQEIYEILTVQDIQEAADVLRPVYDRTKGRDGFVSLEVNPHLARDSQGTIEEVRRLWKKVDRPNIFIKIPGTVEGLAAIKQCLSESVNINITLLFGLPLYRQVAKTYIEALEAVDRQGKKLDRVASVASFFLSRIDVMVDPVLPPGVKARLAVEAGATLGWCEWVGDAGDVIGMTTFGAGAPYQENFKHFGFTVENVTERAGKLVNR